MKFGYDKFHPEAVQIGAIFRNESHNARRKILVPLARDVVRHDESPSCRLLDGGREDEIHSAVSYNCSFSDVYQTRWIYLLLSLL